MQFKNLNFSKSLEVASLNLSRVMQTLNKLLMFIPQFIIAKVYILSQIWIPFFPQFYCSIKKLNIVYYFLLTYLQLKRVQFIEQNRSNLFQYVATSEIIAKVFFFSRKKGKNKQINEIVENMRKLKYSFPLNESNTWNFTW